MTIADEIQSLSPSALIEMFVLDTTMFAGGGLSYFHAGTNELTGPVIWQGQTYQPWPIEASGFDKTTRGSLPRPTIKVANVNGLISAEILLFSDLVGAKVTRKRTFAKYLDAVNFAAGNVNADPNQHAQDDVWYIERKTSETRYLVEWELSSAFDVQGVTLPYRQIIQNYCVWKYKDGNCGYTGTNYFDTNDVATTLANDVCGKRLSSCKARFGQYAVLPFGGFPGVVQYVN